jgi:hypothetical protein
MTLGFFIFHKYSTQMFCEQLWGKPKHLTHFIHLIFQMNKMGLIKKLKISQYKITKTIVLHLHPFFYETEIARKKNPF